MSLNQTLGPCIAY